ncbi:MAG: class I SAM-dependent methyltransferase [Burkholderiales bacterium]|jgi:predicted O-methyltransferase YrrM|nr:class I SAM-dependent methyltransferase [Burkholderiales bacterium]
MYITTLAPEKLDLTLDEVIARLPTLSTPVDETALNEYLNKLYALGRLRHIPNISPQNVVYLHGLLCQNQPKNILEIGCANGYSSLRLWQVARTWNARITTMDISRPQYLEAAHHFNLCQANIELHFGNALQILPTLTGADAFDFILIDAQKVHTLDFFIRARKLATANALIVIDDVIKFKNKMTNFYDYLQAQSIDYDIIQLPDDDDGVMVIQNRII